VKPGELINSRKEDLSLQEVHTGNNSPVTPREEPEEDLHPSRRGYTTAGDLDT